MTMEDQKQQENLKRFDQRLKESTGQLAWFLEGMFALFALMEGYIILYDGIAENLRLLGGYLFTQAWMVMSVLLPYLWSNELLTKRVPQSDSVSKILRYVPVAKKNYIRVRMEYLWNFIWKFAMLAMAILFIVMAASHTFAMGKIIGGAALFFVIPMLTGYMELKVSLLSL